MTKLRDLEPHWIQPGNWATEESFYIGVSFLCPHCGTQKCPTCGHQKGTRLAVQFWPPIDPANWKDRFMTPFPHEGFHHRVSGDTFETLTLAPSVGLDPHWHGMIANGELT